MKCNNKNESFNVIKNTITDEAKDDIASTAWNSIEKALDLLGLQRYQH